MFSKLWRESRYPVEFALLLALVFFLPLREAPKNLFWLAYVVVWLANRARAADFGGHWDRWDSLVAALIASGYLAAAFGGVHRGDNNEWMAVNDVIRYGTLFTCVRRAGYPPAQLLAVLMMAVASCVVAEVEALWNWKVSMVRPRLELFSVGHVNHSAIYMVICLGLAGALLIGCWRQLGRAARAALLCAALLLLIGIFLTASRAAAGIALLLLLLLALVAGRGAGLGRGAWAACLSLILVAVLVGGTGALQTQLARSKSNTVLSERDLIWNRGLVAWRQYPWFGIGMDNYSQISDDRLTAWLAGQGRAYVATDYARAPHGHNVYVNTLVERGAVGLAVLLALLTTWAVALVRLRPAFAQGGAAVALWGASLSGWLVTAGIGLANTTLHHEHAMLAMLTLALWPGAQPAHRA